MKVYSLETVFKNIYIRIQKEYLFVFKKIFDLFAYIRKSITFAS